MFLSALSISCITISGWVLFMQILRIKRAKYIEKINDVEEVYKLLFSVEFPFMWLKGLELALFNTFPFKPVYARLSINKKFIHEPELRYDDTELLLREAWEHGINSDRGKCAFTRLNKIHSHFNIDNRSYLYVLATFVVVPIRLINKYDFRKLTKHEIDCTCKSITMMGSAMGIKDLPHTYSDYVKIIEDEYKGNQIQVDKRNLAIAEKVIEMFLGPFPKFIHSFARRIIYSLLDEPIRKGFGYPKQPILIYYFASFVLLTRAYIIKMFFPIRPVSMAVLRTSTVPGGAPQYQKYRKSGCPFSYPDKYECSKLGQWNHNDAVIKIL